MNGTVVVVGAGGCKGEAIALAWCDLSARRAGLAVSFGDGVGRGIIVRPGDGCTLNDANISRAKGETFDTNAIGFGRIGAGSVVCAVVRCHIRGVIRASVRIVTHEEPSATACNNDKRDDNAYDHRLIHTYPPLVVSPFCAGFNLFAMKNRPGVGRLHMLVKLFLLWSSLFGGWFLGCRLLSDNCLLSGWLLDGGLLWSCCRFAAGAFGFGGELFLQAGSFILVHDAFFDSLVESALGAAVRGSARLLGEELQCALQHTLGFAVADGSLGGDPDTLLC